MFNRDWMVPTWMLKSWNDSQITFHCGSIQSLVYMVLTKSNDNKLRCYRSNFITYVEIVWSKRRIPPKYPTLGKSSTPRRYIDSTRMSTLIRAVTRRGSISRLFDRCYVKIMTKVLIKHIDLYSVKSVFLVNLIVFNPEKHKLKYVFCIT